MAGAFIERLVVGLTGRSHTVSVIVPADEGKGGSSVRHGAKVVRVRYAPRGWETLAYRGRMTEAARSASGMLTLTSLMVAQAWAVTAARRIGRVDLVHAHWWVPGGVSAWLAHIAQRRPYVVTLHGTDVAVLDQSEWARKLARLVLRRAARVTAVSSYLAQRAASVAGLDPERILVQPMPLDVHRLSGVSHGGGGVVTVGRLVEQKQVGVLLEAVAHLRNRGRVLPLRIIGDGPERTALEYRARRLGIEETTRFVGAVEPDEIPEAIGDADVFAFPAVHEGLGLAVAEALVLGVPVVATRQGGGVTDLVPSSGAGRIVEAGDAEEMAHAIDQLAGDPESRRSAAAEGRLLRARLAPDRVARVFEAVYRGALGIGPAEHA